MLKLAVQLALVAAAGWAVWTWVPLGDRTLAQRFRAAGSLERFAAHGWEELFGADAPEAPTPRAPGSRSPATKGAQRPAQGRDAPPPRPTEGHTDADRRALDRIVADRLRD